MAYVPYRCGMVASGLEEADGLCGADGLAAVACGMLGGFQDRHLQFRSSVGSSCVG